MKSAMVGFNLKNGIIFGVLMIAGLCASVFSAYLYSDQPYLAQILPYLSYIGVLLLSPIFICHGPRRDYLPWLILSFLGSVGLYLLSAPFLTDLPNYLRGNIKTVDGIVGSIQATKYDENTEDPNSYDAIRHSNKENIFVNNLSLICEGDLKLNPKVALHKHYIFQYLPNSKWVISYKILDVPPKGPEDLVLKQSENLRIENLR